jgi:hypothetical protein
MPAVPPQFSPTTASVLLLLPSDTRHHALPFITSHTWHGCLEQAHSPQAGPDLADEAHQVKGQGVRAGRDRAQLLQGRRV